MSTETAAAGFDAFDELQNKLVGAFSPTSPIDQAALFAGRHEQRRDLELAVGQKGQHAIVFGERGVGKTSLANIVAALKSHDFFTLKVTCDTSDTYASVWRKVFGEAGVSAEKQQAGFGGQAQIERSTLADRLPEKVAPNDVRRLLIYCAQASGRHAIVVIDEFDRLKKKNGSLFADTIKALSDQAVPATLILVGVADTVDELIKEHASVERALMQIHMPRMSSVELQQIVVRGLQSVEMEVEVDALTQIVRLSLGLPHYTHLITFYAAHAAAASHRRTVTVDDVKVAIENAVHRAQQSIKSSYHKATTSPRKDNLYGNVLLACALTKTDGLGTFAAADVREPLSAIMKKRYEISAFGQHLNDFSDSKRGAVLGKRGTSRRYRFRFTQPLLPPFILMTGISAGKITLTDIAAGAAVFGG
jgi:Cdc6-like AAA superfamily ATPase